jgi:hypothetical protein
MAIAEMTQTVKVVIDGNRLVMEHAHSAGTQMLEHRCWNTAGTQMLKHKCWNTDAETQMLEHMCWNTNAGT